MDLTYPVQCLGQDTAVLQSLANGTHPFCEVTIVTLVTIVPMVTIVTLVTMVTLVTIVTTGNYYNNWLPW